MKEKERSPQDQAWVEQKKLNAERNRLIFTGWDGGIYRRGIRARQLFRGILNEGKRSASSLEVYSMPDGIGTT